jgi:PII-like signaling protein
MEHSFKQFFLLSTPLPIGRKRSHTTKYEIRSAYKNLIEYPYRTGLLGGIILKCILGKYGARVRTDFKWRVLLNKAKNLQAP